MTEIISIAIFSVIKYFLTAPTIGFFDRIHAYFTPSLLYILRVLTGILFITSSRVGSYSTAWFEDVGISFKAAASTSECLLSIAPIFDPALSTV